MNRQQYIDEMAEAILERYTAEEIRDTEKLYESCWIDDVVTGNGSGSFYFNYWKAKESVVDIEAIGVLYDAVQEGFVEKEQVADWFLDYDWESLDVTIRCYLLHEAIEEAITRLNMHESAEGQEVER